MASLLRSTVKLRSNFCQLLRMNHVRRQAFNPRVFQQACFISTSNKKKDSAAVTDSVQGTERGVEKLEEKDENWISYGYSLTDREEDEWSHHVMLFVAVTMCVVWGLLGAAYYPDFQDNAWATREAYLELARREQNGLPLIDANLIDPSNVTLPSDEELGDFEIIV